MNANERTITQMIIERLEKRQSIKGLVNLLHEHTMYTLPLEVRLGNVNASNQAEVIEACKTILKNGEPSQ